MSGSTPGFETLESLLKLAGINETNQLQRGLVKKFMLVGTHAQQTTGYSKVTSYIVQELAKHSDIRVYHFGFQRFTNLGPTYRPYPAGVEVYDPQAEEERDGTLPREMGFGFSQLAGYIRKIRPHVIMIYNDAIIISAFLEKLEQALTDEERTSYKMIFYLDQVYTIQRPELLMRMEKHADAYFAFTSYWRDILLQQGIKKPVYILRHGFNPHQFQPMSRAETRSKHNLPQNLFLMLNLNRNTPRKRYDLVVTAFAELIAKYPQKPIALLAVTDQGSTGAFPLQEIFMRELARRGVPIDPHIHKLMITKTSMNYTDETINELYAASDIGITAADGEGFGLCQFEAMGIGIPQVVPDVGGFKDFCNNDNSVIVPTKYRYYLPFSLSPIGGEIHVVDPHDLCMGIEEYLLDTEKREAHGQRARETVLAYDWSVEVDRLATVIRTL
jgi:glycosyltransferase involved in cell wall biosynthesis